MLKLCVASASVTLCSSISASTFLNSVKFLSKDFEKKLEDIDGLKDEIYEQICDAYILKYKPGEDIGIDDVEITDEFVSEEG